MHSERNPRSSAAGGFPPKLGRDAEPIIGLSDNRERSSSPVESALLGKIGEGALLWATHAEEMFLFPSQFAFQIGGKIVRWGSESLKRGLGASRPYRLKCGETAIEGEIVKREILQTIANEHTERDYEIEVECLEFTCLCPQRPDQPDFATFKITYVPNQTLIELKSLKLYLMSFRNDEIYHEAATNEILEDLVAAGQPRRMRVVGYWNIRGGIRTTVTVQYKG